MDGEEIGRGESVFGNQNQERMKFVRNRKKENMLSEQFGYDDVIKMKSGNRPLSFSLRLRYQIKPAGMTDISFFACHSALDAESLVHCKIFSFDSPQIHTLKIPSRP